MATIVKVLGVVLLLTAFSSHALTLGRMRGAALIGQGLDITVQVQTDPGDAPGALCFGADVFHADTQQDPGRVRVTVEPTQVAQVVNVRVSSSTPIDEPIVTVYLRAGCAQQTSRRYVLLADVITEPAPAAAVVPAPLPLVDTARLPATAGPGGLSQSALSGDPAGTSAAATSSTVAAAPPAPATRPRARPAQRANAAATPARRQARATPAAGTPSRSRAAAPTSAAPGQPRLQLDPLEVLSERVATLESATAAVPAELAARDAMDARRLATLEENVKSLLALAARNEASLIEIRAQLQRAESQRYQNPLVYALAALLLLCLLALAYLLSLRRQTERERGEDWWREAPSEHGVQPSRPATVPASSFGQPSGFTPVSRPAPVSAPATLQDTELQVPLPMQSGAPRSVPVPLTQVDVSLVEMSESSFDRLMQSGASHSAVRKTQATERMPPGVGGIRQAINSEELFDIRQQAEFFVSLGQTDQAVRILENRISESGESSPHAYLDLLKIFHSLGLKADFRQVREDFNLLFSARVPEFSSFSEEGKGLEEYPETLATICDEWGTPSIFTTLEERIFRDPTHPGGHLFDLAAFRDLLLLHGVAQWVATAPDSRPGPLFPRAMASAATGFPALQVPAGAVSSLSGEATADMPLPPIDGMVELDIDLSDMAVDPGPDPMVSALPPEQYVPQSPSALDNLIDFDLTDAEAAEPSRQRH